MKWNFLFLFLENIKMYRNFILYSLLSVMRGVVSVTTEPWTPGPPVWRLTCSPWSCTAPASPRCAGWSDCTAWCWAAWGWSSPSPGSASTSTCSAWRVWWSSGSTGQGKLSDWMLGNLWRVGEKNLNMLMN